MLEKQSVFIILQIWKIEIFDLWIFRCGSMILDMYVNCMRVNDCLFVIGGV